jgi:hypothetical protein
MGRGEHEHMIKERNSSMSTEEHKALIRCLIEKVWNQVHLAVYTGAKYDQVYQKLAG